ncbi:MAG: hypothetical protein JWO69_779 [Thermoleophilia bacterium]|jgi:hypothetical protein|nr:hypothetical protein [Thermoleophilia bacterium]
MRTPHASKLIRHTIETSFVVAVFVLICAAAAAGTPAA